MKLSIVIFSLMVFAQVSYGQNYTLSGYIQDESTGENLIGATVYSLGDKQGAVTNYYGFFSLTLPAGTKQIVVSYVGYTELAFEIELSENKQQNFKLATDLVLEEVVITGEPEMAERTQMSTVNLSTREIKSLPALLGEVDVLKTIQLMPGIQSGSEGSSGLYVRGGGPDQNLILLDGVPVYNASHLFGFFSVFNADAINNVSVIKGGFPARYGGRLSSVIDISMKEGNNQEFHGEGAIGLVSSKLTLEGPIKSENTSFIVSGRRTYIDALASPIIRAASQGTTRAGYYFYDVNAKVNHRFSDKDRVYISAYTGLDKGFTRYRDSYLSSGNELEYEEYAGLDWGNITTALRWNHVFGPKLFANLTATYSKYEFDVRSEFEDEVEQNGRIETEEERIRYFSGIRDYALKLDFDYAPSPNHAIKTGVNLTQHRFNPGVLALNSSFDNDTTLGATNRDALEYFAYLEDDYKISERLKVNAGIHFSGFHVDGETYTSIQPRIAGRYMISPGFSAKASFVKMAQFIHLLTNSGIGLPTDLWVPATGRIRPQSATQFAVGLARNFDSGIEVSIEAYTKEMNNLIAYREGATYFSIDDSWEDRVTTGNGDSRGIELFVSKKKGRLTGWVGYTLSKTTRQFDELNEGKEFPYRYDRRHDISIASVFKVREGLELSGTWVYGSGNAITLPVGRFNAIGPEDQFYDNEVQIYEGRNGFRMRSYHRMDLSISWIKNKGKRGTRTWSLGVYNVYSRANPFFINTGFDRQGNKKFIQYSLFPIIPSVRYGFKF